MCKKRQKVFLEYTHLFCGSFYLYSRSKSRSSDSKLLLLKPFPSSYYMTFSIAASNDENDLLFVSIIYCSYLVEIYSTATDFFLTVGFFFITGLRAVYFIVCYLRRVDCYGLECCRSGDYYYF